MIRIIIVLGLLFLLYKLQEKLYKKHWDQSLKLDIAYGSTDAFEGGTVSFQETLWNGKRLPMPYVSASYNQHINLRQTDLSGKDTYYGRLRDTFFVSPGKRRVTRNTMLVCEKRGFYFIDGATISSADIFLSRSYNKAVEVYTSLTVYPREIEIDEVEIPYKTLSGEILTKRFILPDPFEFTGIREYQPFDSFKQLNFKAWGKTGEPMSNIYGHTVSQEVRIILNLQPYNPFIRDGVYENAIRLAAFLARKYLEAGIPVSFVTNGLDCITNLPGRSEKGQSSRHLREIYEILARISVEKNWECDHIKEFLPSVSELSSMGCVVALISSFADESVYNWQANALESGAKVLWVAPKTARDEDKYLGDVVVWDVDNG